MKTLKKRNWIEFVDDERGLGNGIIVTLQPGLAFEIDPSCGVMGFDTLAEALAATRVDCIVPIEN
jgi:hypothetical protein